MPTTDTGAQNGDGSDGVVKHKIVVSWFKDTLVASKVSSPLIIVARWMGCEVEATPIGHVTIDPAVPWTAHRHPAGRFGSPAVGGVSVKVPMSRHPDPAQPTLSGGGMPTADVTEITPPELPADQSVVGVAGWAAMQKVPSPEVLTPAVNGLPPSGSGHDPNTSWLACGVPLGHATVPRTQALGCRVNTVFPHPVPSA